MVFASTGEQRDVSGRNASARGLKGQAGACFALLASVRVFTSWPGAVRVGPLSNLTRAVGLQLPVVIILSMTSVAVTMVASVTKVLTDLWCVHSPLVARLTVDVVVAAAYLPAVLHCLRSA